MAAAMSASRLVPRAAPPVVRVGRAGALAGAVALFVLLVGPLLLGRPGFLEVVHNGVTAYVPVPLFDAALRTFGAAAKGLLFVGVAGGVVAAGALVAIGLGRAGSLGGPTGRPIRLAASAAAVAWLLGELVVLPVLGAGPFGSAYRGDGVALQVPFAVACLAYGLVLGGSFAPTADRPAGSGEPSAARESAIGRRALLARGLALVGWGAVLGSGLVVIGRVAVATRTVTAPRPQAAGGFGPTPRLTPVADFYVVAKDLLPPTIDPADWTLSVGGLVERERSFRLADLRRLPRVEGERTLECISNEVVVWGGLAGNQRWAGVRLLDLLAEVGVRPEATHVLWRSADGYTESLPLAEVDDRVWLVDEMGSPGTPLTREHGFPLRVLVPGRYGMKQPKWLTAIVLTDHDEPGYWVTRGWDAAAVVRTWSRIDEPRAGDGVPVGRPFPVFGVAFAGERGIRRVEVSVDDGRSWTEAELEAEGSGIGLSVWRRWRAQVELAVAGPAVLVVRATDGLGVVQEAEVRPPLPAGATGYHRVPVVGVSGG
jgi:DMSO/TMAO reductase YedYZ molybdopterin-dependent catalytic subunit